MVTQPASTVLVTGSNGFVGQAVCHRLMAQGCRVVAVTRAGRPAPMGTVAKASPDLGPDADWQPLLEGVDAVVHLAARVHVMQDRALDPLAEFRAHNALATRRLAEQSAAMGVRHLVFMSTIKVSGERTAPDQPFRADLPPAPVDPYGISKLEAEQALREVAETSGLAVSVIRPPLVYGPGVKGNLPKLMAMIARGLPIPVSTAANARSFIGVTNLADLVATCLGRDTATPFRLFLAKDGDVSTAQLVSHLAAALGRPCRIIPVPHALLRLAGKLTGNSGAVERMTGSLVVDDTETRRLLNWTPPLSFADGMADTARWFVAHRA
ncbi:MAG: NAD-dependent epimerase/dehydratase family protein [Rhodospirillaceae bacterium]|nr:NAD-dependent epimerase/dehydratase family protein [Rhodospirillales bacterium]